MNNKTEQQKVKYRKVLTPRVIMCANCTATMVINGSQHCLTLEDAHNLAVNAHAVAVKQNGFLCTNPELAIETTNTWVDEKILTRLATKQK